MSNASLPDSRKLNLLKNKFGSKISEIIPLINLKVLFLFTLISSFETWLFPKLGESSYIYVPLPPKKYLKFLKKIISVSTLIDKMIIGITKL